MKLITKENFIKRASLYHREYYDYSLVDFKTPSKLVKIICPEHRNV